ncbi:tetratricopeptide repeat protein [Mucilaginibacter lutimaris]|uniref:Tetratricopeptide repeat protein n=1 Tax=Mucilaginibacter lutimaris TaxID=931629 RepID=A0ABW2ZBC4_9SPHI
MKKVILFLFVCWIQQAYSQKADTALKFDKRYTQCEKKWVVLSKVDTAKKYNYGYVYIDEQAGFTFDLQGAFAVDEKGRYVGDTMLLKKTGSIKYRIAPNWKPLALLPVKHLQELKLPIEPAWIKNYYHYTDTAYHNYRLGWVYNDANECDTALKYLEKAYQINPHKADVEFEMAYAYNVLKRYEDAVKVLKPAIDKNPDNPLLIKELGYAYLKLNALEQALAVYLRAYNAFTEQKSEAKGEAAFNSARIYKRQEKLPEYKIWMMKAKDCTPETSPYYKYIVAEGF